MEYGRTCKWITDFFRDKYHREMDKLSVKKQVASLENGTNFYVLFPGYKVNIPKNRWDFRVDIEKNGKKLPLSHANIIVDIYNKCYRHPEIIPYMKIFIINLLKEGDFDPFTDCRQLLEINNIPPPSEDLLQEAYKAHQDVNKKYYAEGNSWNLTFQELTTAIFWIALQEDINYPGDKYEGRLMAFKRYYEAILCAEGRQSVMEPIKRALNEKSRPQNLDGVDYTLLKK